MGLGWLIANAPDSAKKTTKQKQDLVLVKMASKLNGPCTNRNAQREDRTIEINGDGNLCGKRTFKKRGSARPDFHERCIESWTTYGVGLSQSGPSRIVLLQYVVTMYTVPDDILQFQLPPLQITLRVPSPKSAVKPALRR